jgi:cyclophilin family peptidyl-prolyl cis-trans isomerase
LTSKILEELSMKERERIRARREEEAKRRKATQTVGLVIVAAVIALGVWFSLPKKPKAAKLTGDYGEATACASFEDIPAASQYTAPPQRLDPFRQYYAAVVMENGGAFAIQLFADKAPITVNSFVFLACKGYFDGLTFHRVIEGFMAQGGDPTGTGTGGPGYEFVNEDSGLVFDKAGVVAMANAGRDTNGSQFFITFGAADHLNGGYTIFGQVVEGMDVVNGIRLRDPQTDPLPGDVMESVTITIK